MFRPFNVKFRSLFSCRFLQVIRRQYCRRSVIRYLATCLRETIFNHRLHKVLGIPFERLSQAIGSCSCLVDRHSDLLVESMRRSSFSRVFQKHQSRWRGHSGSACRQRSLQHRFSAETRLSESASVDFESISSARLDGRVCPLFRLRFGSTRTSRRNRLEISMVPNEPTQREIVASSSIGRASERFLWSFWFRSHQQVL